MERLGQIALRVLQDCAFKAGLDEASGRLQGPERIEQGEMTGFQSAGPTPPLTVGEKTDPTDRAEVTPHRSEFDLRAVPRRAWLGGGDPLPRPSSRLLIANNDNRHAGSTSRAATVQLWQV